MFFFYLLAGSQVKLLFYFPIYRFISSEWQFVLLESYTCLFLSRIWHSPSVVKIRLSHSMRLRTGGWCNFDVDRCIAATAATQPLDQGDLFGKNYFNTSVCVCVCCAVRESTIAQQILSKSTREKEKNMVKCTFGCCWPLLHTCNQRTKAIDPNDKMNECCNRGWRDIEKKKRKKKTETKHKSLATHLRKNGYEFVCN